MEVRKERKTKTERTDGRKRREDREGKCAGLDALAGRFWPTGLMFDIPVLGVLYYLVGQNRKRTAERFKLTKLIITIFKNDV